MNMVPLALTLVLAVPGLACGGSSEPDGVTPSAAAAEQASPAPPGAPASDAKPVTPVQAPPLTPGDRGPVVARVNGTPIYKNDYEGALANFMQSNQIGPEAPDDRVAEAKKLVMDGLIGSELLYQKAKAIPIEVPQAEVDQAIASTKSGMGEEAFNAELLRRGMTQKDLENLIRQNLMVQKMIKEQVVDALTVADAEIKAFYDANQKEMQKPENVEASHILVRSNASDPAEKKAAARKKIDEAQKRIKAGEDFAAMAKEYSEDGSAANGGSLGPIVRGQTVPAFEEPAFKLAIGQVSDVVETQFGYHIIKVTGKHTGSVAPYDEVKGKIGEHLKQKKAREAIEKLVESLRASAKVELL
jgi:peptidyl-prolyl cis-trans isomerase C